MNQLNPTANNWILPIKGDGSHPDTHTHLEWLASQSMAIKIQWQPAVTFNELNQTWWENYFSKMKYADLLQVANLLGVKPVGRAPNKAAVIRILSDHYRARFK